MAVQKSKKTRSKRDMRRSHDSLTNAVLSEERETGEIHRRHHISLEGYYKGRQVIKKKEKFEDE